MQPAPYWGITMTSTDYRVETKHGFSPDWLPVVGKDRKPLTFASAESAKKHLRMMRETGAMGYIACAWRIIKICWEGESNDHI